MDPGLSLRTQALPPPTARSLLRLQERMQILGRAPLPQSPSLALPQPLDPAPSMTIPSPPITTPSITTDTCRRLPQYPAITAGPAGSPSTAPDGSTPIPDSTTSFPTTSLQENTTGPAIILMETGSSWTSATVPTITPLLTRPLR